MSVKKSLCRIDIGRQPYFLQTSAKDDGKDGFELVVTDAVNSWEGKISRQRLGQLAKKVNMKLDEFTEQTLKALTRQELGDLAFEYQMKADASGTSEFTWKKVMSNENIKFQLGSATLEVVEDSAESIQDLFIFTIENASSLRDDIRHLERENERLSTERSNALKRLEKCVGMHEEMEKELFSKFQVVLNDKKAKIRCLKREVSDANSAAQKASKNGSDTAQSRTGNSSVEESNQENLIDKSEDEISTDEESKATRKTKKRTAAASRIDPDTSLILGDEETTKQTAAPTARRRRRREVTNKQTPSKPSIPKVSSIRTERSATPSTPGTSEGGRMSRTSSGRSTRSDPDVDMLFDEL